jgi:hypothetical protein
MVSEQIHAPAALPAWRKPPERTGQEAGWAPETGNERRPFSLW